jgi:hypothetical protein
MVLILLWITHILCCMWFYIGATSIEVITSTGCITDDQCASLNSGAICRRGQCEVKVMHNLWTARAF